MTTTLFVVALVVLTALFFDFTNGFHDSANAMATSVATGALRPRTAVLIAAVLNVVGAFLSTEVAKTISGGIVNDAVVTPTMIFAGLVGAILWNLTTWLFGLPSSSSHALFGGLIGAVLVGAGTSGVNFSVVVSKILLPAVVAPLVAGLAAGLATFLVYRWLKRADEEPAAGLVPARPDRVGLDDRAGARHLGRPEDDGRHHPGADHRRLPGIRAPARRFWVIATAGLAIGLGTYSGGWRIMRTMGKGIVDVTRAAGIGRRDHLGRSDPGVLAHGLRAVHHPGVLRLDHRLRRRPEAGARCAGAPPARWSTAGCSPCPPPAWSAASPPRSPLTGTIGLVIVFAALVAGAATIWTISRRAPVSSENVNDSRRRRHQPGEGPRSRPDHEHRTDVPIHARK